MISADVNIPELNGLVLAGGKSRRMGMPKDLINWHGQEQRCYLADVMKDYCKEVFVSCRHDQVQGLDSRYRALPDTFLNIGPMGGILSALRARRDRAWLVIACDLPLLDEHTIRFLVSNRSRYGIATTYESPHDQLPEPLITIWEPESYPILLQFLGQGITCPRKALINSEKTILQPTLPDALMNVNTPEDAERARGLLDARKLN